MDDKGRLVPNASEPVKISVGQSDVLLAFGSVGARHDHGFEKPETTSGEGHALAILKLSPDAGNVKVTVSGENIAASEIVF